MNKINLLEAINLTEDRFIEETIDIDTPQKLKKVIAGEKNRYFKKSFIVCAACFCIVIVGAIALNLPQLSPGNTQIENPIIEVNSSEEMERHLGYEVPVIEDKAVNTYTVIDDGQNAKHGRIVYSDNTEFDMEEGQTDVSGIYGGEKEKTENICGTDVDINRYEDIVYGVWSDETYSYAYSAPEDYDSLEEDIKTIINKTKQGADNQ